MLQEFIKYLNDMVGTTVTPISLYVWGGQGQYISDGKVFNYKGGYLGEVEAWLKKVETSTNNANRVIKLYKKIRSYYKGYIRCFDCSGLGTFFLYNLHQLISSDKNANGLKGMCQKLTKDKLKKGDWVFRVYSSGRRKRQANSQCSKNSRRLSEERIVLSIIHSMFLHSI